MKYTCEHIHANNVSFVNDVRCYIERITQTKVEIGKTGDAEIPYIVYTDNNEFYTKSSGNAIKYVFMFYNDGMKIYSYITSPVTAAHTDDAYLLADKLNREDAAFKYLIMKDSHGNSYFRVEMFMFYPDVAHVSPRFLENLICYFDSAWKRHAPEINYCL